MSDTVKPIGKRRHAREIAVQFLYQHDLNGGERDEAIRYFWLTQPDVAAGPRAFGEELIRGVTDNQTIIDAKISQYTEHWGISRIAAVDRNILRLAIYEMLFRDDIPPVVSINEAVELAKKFSTRESGAFVNGILDKLKFDLPRPARTAGPTP